MQTAQLRYESSGGWTAASGSPEHVWDAQLVLLFADRVLLEAEALVEPLRARFPHARVVACSTGGEILRDQVLVGGAVATALRFEATDVVVHEVELSSRGDSERAGAELARSLTAHNLKHVLVFSEGLEVNGSALAKGIAGGLPPGVAVTGGLAGDGERFERTLVGSNAEPGPSRIAAIGLYGERLRVGMGTLGGWDVIDTERVATRSEGNILLELDGAPALPLYKEMIGAHSYGLPATGLLYPMYVHGEQGAPGVVRTLLAVDEQAQSLTFAGDLPTGSRVQLMRAHPDRLIDAAGGAAERSLIPAAESPPEFVLLVSCIGRRLVLQVRTEEEVRRARAVFGDEAAVTGFYSYGEISPATPTARCELHNQTMTITTFSER